jgi:hypothetical protein
LLPENRANTTDDFYELFPDIKAVAQIFDRERMQIFAQANFKAKELEIFSLILSLKRQKGKIRKENACRRDLLKWGDKIRKQ